MQLFLIRHTAVGVSGLCYGHHDVPLADTFAAEAAATRARLPPDVLGAPGLSVYASPASRCRLLAEALVPHPAAIQFDERLRELHFGDWEGQPWDAVPRPELDRWSADYERLAPPNGETFGAMRNRLTGFLADLAARAEAGAADAADAADATDAADTTDAAGPVLVFTHGGAVRAVLGGVLEFPLANAFRLTIDYGSLTRLRYAHGRWQVLGVNG